MSESSASVPAPPSAPNAEGSERLENPQSIANRATAVSREAREQVGEVTAEAKAQMANLVDNGKQQLHQQADQQTGKVVESLRRVTDKMRALGEGRPDEAGSLRDYLDDLTARLERFAETLESRGLDGISSDVQGFARRRPGAFLGGAAAAGFLAGRLLRSVKDQDQADGDELRATSSASSERLSESRPSWEGIQSAYSSRTEPLDVS